MQPLKILHIFRAPVGGLFRHVADLAREQSARGHEVGLVADSTTGGEQAEKTLAALSETLKLGMTRTPMSRPAGLNDVPAVQRVAGALRATKADVVHGHGAKGGAYARLAHGNALRVYTPHGGSLHFSRANPFGFAYLTVESWLLRRTDLAMFESEFAQRAYEEKIGKPRGLSRVAYNGVREEEFDPVTPAPDAADILFVGELRTLKGIGTLLDAIALLKSQGNELRAVIVGDGPDRATFEAQSKARSLETLVRFPGAMPARKAFPLGRVLAVPSYAESLPYIVLEAAAAGLPVVATNVGGIPEIFGDERNALIAPRDAKAFAKALLDTLAGKAAARTDNLRNRVREKFTVTAMTDAILAAYAEALTRKSA